MTKIKYPPVIDFTPAINLVDVFLAGSIEMGIAENWQDPLGIELEKLECVRNIYNPRRKDFDVSQQQSIDNKYFKDQVDWELSSIEKSKIIFMYFDPNTKSPISLMELGYLIGLQRGFTQFDVKQEVIVCCPDGFWRQGNVEIMIQRELERNHSNSQNVGIKFPSILFFKDYEKSVEFLKSRIWAKHKVVSNQYGYYPYASPNESDREQKAFEGKRGLKIPKEEPKETKEE